MGLVVSFVNAKGGVGKTTTVANVGAALAARGRRVLMVDVDPQASLTGICGLTEMATDPQRGRHLWRVMAHWVDGGNAVLEQEDVMRPEGYCGADLVAATAELHRADMQFLGVVGREAILRNMLTSLRAAYDFILLDARPALGLLPTNVLVASDLAVIPMVAEPMAMQGLALIVGLLQLVKSRLNPQLRLLGVVITMFRSRLRLSQEMLANLRGAVEEAGVPILEAMIPWTTVIGRATGAQKAVRVFAPGSRGALAYEALADEVLARLSQ